MEEASATLRMSLGRMPMVARSDGGRSSASGAFGSVKNGSAKYAVTAREADAAPALFAVFALVSLKPAAPALAVVADAAAGELLLLCG